ncbi:NAD-dependent epimerase/dehydratase family protein [Xanthomonas sp. AmX2]|uniref:NAD-dependent epimerase/dehydratase family protein n=1 Tax=Xanthomonas sp. TaxID=29446 RepID=UPI001981685A|nr:NAD-dependent epimerase/dehydratase family protein [Xanthomonas sp.]MBN6150360.1 NAD-dependent epimerase/dehydratase family protein [Xanthomonas sp.]
MNMEHMIKALEGPILVIGASGFIGANLLRACLAQRSDVIGTTFSGDSWRLHGIAAANLAFLNLTDAISVKTLLHRIAPRTVFDCSSFGAYSFEDDFQRIHATNYLSFIGILEQLKESRLAAYVRAGSSSEYGINASGPDEDAPLMPNSHYAVSKAAASQAIAYYGKIRQFPIVNLRLYSVYGPYEDSSRLIPALCERGLRGHLPMFAHADVSRDFVHIDDVVLAFVSAAARMRPQIAGESFNIGSGVPTRLDALAEMARSLFGIDETPQFSASAGRAWDVSDWFANPDKAARLLGWKATTDLTDGLRLTSEWWKSQLTLANFSDLTKKSPEQAKRNSVSAIIACYKDEQAIPVMHQRLTEVFQQLGIDYEIIFVNDCSPDDSAETIRALSASDPHVIGITHSRNFGSQAAFRSGMEYASKEACVLLDGDLQDPPELIADFVREWRNGAEVVYGRRVKREMPFLLETCYRTFYRLFSAMSEVPVPKDAGDFSLLDRTVVYWMLQCNERDAFLRGLRAFVGFRQVGVDYLRPERMFGTSTNNWIRNIGWAKKGIFSFSRMPLHLLTALGGGACLLTILLATLSIALRLLHPESVPKGITFISLLVMFFGSMTIFGIGLLGEYIGKIFEEAKARPAFIRRNLIIHGEIRLPPTGTAP